MKVVKRVVAILIILLLSMLIGYGVHTYNRLVDLGSSEEGGDSNEVQEVESEETEGSESESGSREEEVE